MRVSSARETAPRALWGTDEFLDTTGARPMGQKRHTPEQNP